MAHKVGRSIKKEILDDALGIDENKTFGIKNKTFVGGALAKVTPGAKNNIWGQAGDFVEDKVTAPVKDLAGNLLDPGKAAREAQQAQLDAYNAQVSSLEAKENESNRMALASTLLSRGKGKFFDITRPEEVEKFLIEQEGNYLDPFPDYLRKSGDRLLGDLESTGENINNYIGSADDRMRDFQPTLEGLQSTNQNAIDRLQSIYDGRMESKMNEFRDRGVDITRQLQDLNTRSGDMEYGLQRGVLDNAERYADSLGRSVDMQTALANRQFDELDRMPGLMKDQNRELEQRFGDTYLSELASARGNLGAEYGAAEGMRGAEYGAAGRVMGSELGAADMIQRGERAKALAAGANAENLANSQQRGIRGAMVGQGGGTAQNMGNAMIRAQLGQQRGDLLADALIRDAERRGQAGIDYAGRTGASDIGYADRIGGSNMNFADRVGTAGIDNSMKLENILDTEADLAGAKIGSERFKALGDINPAMADVYRDEAMLNRANTELGFGDTRMTAEAQNLGLDQGIVDTDQGLYSDLMAQQLSNTGMIPGLGMQEAMLPALMGEAALSAQGPLARSVSPYTATGTLPQGQTIFQNTPYTPPASGGKKNWVDYLADAPGYINKGKEVLGGLRGIFS